MKFKENVFKNIVARLQMKIDLHASDHSNSKRGDTQIYNSQRGDTQIYNVQPAWGHTDI